MLHIETPSGTCRRARVDGELTIYNAAAIKSGLLPLLDGSADLEINLANVSEIDSAGVQLFMLAKKEQERLQRNLTLTDHSGSVLDAFELLGLMNYFKDPVLLKSRPGESDGS